MKDVTLRDVALDPRGQRVELTNLALGFGYRHCSAPTDLIFVSAELKGEPAAPTEIQSRMAAINASREESQPLRTRTGGSTFANPKDVRAQGKRAWELIDAVGGRGLTQGGAMVSDKHCNFLINTGTATAADIEALGEELRRRVREQFGVSLEWEIRVVGDKPAEGATS
jgi:UDP-N-acetylmuramate dehydrogenase